MAGWEETAKIILKVVAQTTDAKKVEKALANTSASAIKAAKAFARVGIELQKQGVVGKQYSGKLRELSKNMAAYGIKLNQQGKFIDTVTNKTMTAKNVVEKMNQAVVQGKKAMVSAQAGSAVYKQGLAKVKAEMSAFGISGWRARANLKGLKTEIDKGNIGINEQGNLFDTNTGKTMQWGDATRKLSKYSMRPFRGELLSTMFVGMGMKRLFGGMIRQVLEMTGIFDVWRGILASILLPILVPLIQQYLPKFLEWLKDPSHKKFLGNLIILGYLFGVVLTAIGFLGLGIDGLIKTFSGLGGVFKWMWTFLIGTGEKAGWLVKLFQFLGTAVSKFFAVGFPIFMAIFDLFGGLAGATWKFGRMLLWILVALGAVIALIAGAPAAIVAAIVAAVSALIMLLSKLQPVRDFFQWIWDAAKGIVGAIGGFVGKLFGGGGKSEIPQMANGGIVTRPTLAMIGEAGPEAVVPLSGAGAGAGGVGAINYSPTINVSSTGGSIDVDNIARMVNERLIEDLRRLGVR